METISQCEERGKKNIRTMEGNCLMRAENTLKLSVKKTPVILWKVAVTETTGYETSRIPFLSEERRKKGVCK